MQNKEAILQAIYRAVDSVNAERPPESQLTKTVDSQLYGAKSILDSLGLVNLIVATEREIEDAMGVSVVLASDRAMSQKRSPFLTIETLANYIAELLDEAGAGRK